MATTTTTTTTNGGYNAPKLAKVITRKYNLVTSLSDIDEQEWSGGGEGDATVAGGPSQHSGCCLSTKLPRTEANCSSAAEIPRRKVCHVSKTQNASD